MSNENALGNELRVILDQLKGLEQILNDSINHTIGTDLSYPTVSKKYNIILKRLRVLSAKNPNLEIIVKSLRRFAENDFLERGNYKYAVGLQTTIKILCLDLVNLNLPAESKVSQYVGKPVIFVSYVSDELALADFIKKIIYRLTNNQIEVFIAKRDIPPGHNPLKVMMETKLKLAQAIILICSIKSKSSSWVWWESAAVWAKEGGVYPLFTNITPAEFGEPLNLVSQGKDYFDSQELMDVLKAACAKLRVSLSEDQLSQEEFTELIELKEKWLKVENPVQIELSYKKLQITSDLHKYSLIFNVINRTKKVFKNVIVELYFPSAYIEKIGFLSGNDYIHSYVLKDKPGYTCINFDYSALPPEGKRELSQALLPGKTLKIFGEYGAGWLHYVMDHQRWDQHEKFEVEWKVYINGEGPIEGRKPLHSLQIF